MTEQLTGLQTTCTRGRTDNASTQSNHYLKVHPLPGAGYEEAPDSGRGKGQESYGIPEMPPKTN